MVAPSVAHEIDTIVLRPLNDSAAAIIGGALKTVVILVAAQNKNVEIDLFENFINVFINDNFINITALFDHFDTFLHAVDDLCFGFIFFDIIFVLNGNGQFSVFSRQFFNAAKLPSVAKIPAKNSFQPNFSV